MYAWLLKRLAQRIYDRLGQGDPRLAEAFVANDARLEFPGRNPFAGEHRSRDEVRLWLRRFAHFRPTLEIHSVIASGPPWDIRGCMHFTDAIGDPNDPGRYVNEGVCLFRLRWGRIVGERVFLDTQAVDDFFGTETADEFFAGTPVATLPAQDSSRRRGRGLASIHRLRAVRAG